MKRLVLTALLLTACASKPDITPPVKSRENMRPSNSASLWDQQDPESLFGNRRAREVGDLLTVLVSINDEAQILNDSQRNRLSEREYDVQGLFGLPQWADGRLPGDAGLTPAVDVTSQQRMRGQGQLRRQDRVTLRLAARVTDRLPGGDLVIEGRQSVQVGADVRRLMVTGIVRPEDISRGNTVQHDRIAEANIRYVGSGPTSSTGRKGLGNRILDVIVPF